MRKRIWAVLLTMCLLVGLLPTTALAGGLTVYKTYAELTAALENPTEIIYLEPAADFGWPDTGALSIPANTQIVVIDSNEDKAPWEIPSGITVNFEQNTHGISCSTLTVNGTMHKAYSSQGGLDFETLVIGPTGVFSCEDDREGYPTVASVYIAAGETLEVQKGADMNARVRLDGTLTGEGTVSGQVEVSGGYSSTAANATLSGELTLTGGLTVGSEDSDTYADRLTIPAGSHITAKDRCWTSIDNATLNLNGTLEFKRDSTDSGYSNPYINAGGKIVMDGGRLVLNTPYRLQEGVLDWEEGEIITYAKIQAAIPTPLISGTGTIYFNDSESAVGEEYGWIFDCYADDAVVAADAVKAGTYDADKFDPMSWTLVCAVDLEHIDIEHSWTREHNWDNGEVLTEPTCTKPGEKLLTCTDEDCGETKIAVIPATGHTYEDGVCTICGAEEVQYDVSNIRFSAEDADHPLLVWDCTPAEGVTCNVYVTYDGGVSWDCFETEIADSVCDIMEPGMGGVSGIKIEMVDSDGAIKVIATDVTIRISAEETTGLKDLSGTVSDFGDGKNFSWTISGFSENTLVWVNFTDADGSIRSGLANVCTEADGSLSDKTPYGAADHDTDNIYIGEAYEYGDIAVQDEGKNLSYTMTMVGKAVKLSPESDTPVSDVVLYVNGVDMANGGTVEGAAYDADTNTLTLNGAAITNYYTIPLTGSATDPRAGIYYQGEAALNIMVSGGSTISVVPGVTGTSTAIPAFGIYADGPVNVQLDSYLNILPGTADGAESDDKSDLGAKVLGGAVYVAGNMAVAGSSFLRYLNFGTFQYQSGTSGLQTANNNQMPFQVDGNLTVSNGPSIMGGEMKVGGNASVAGKLNLTAVVGNHYDYGMTSPVYAADATLDVGGTLDLTGGSVTIGSGCTRANYAGLKAGTLCQSGGTLTLNNDEKNYSIQCDDLVQTGGTLTANCVVEAGSSAHLSSGSLTAAALTGMAITVDGTADVDLTGISSGASMGGLGANITISGGTVDITGQSFGIETANLTVTGGTTTVTAPVALSFSDILKRNGGNFSITGGTLKLVAEGGYYGSTIAIRWDDVSGNATSNTHGTVNVTVPVAPSGAKFLETVQTLNDVSLYAATYVAGDVDEVIVSGGYASNGLTAITFGAEPCENHDWGDWAETQAPTCTEAGVEKRTCTVCGETETRNITALGHDYKAVVTAPTCEAQGYTTHTCSRCSDSYVDTYVNALGHTWGQWTVTTPATCTEAGAEIRTCTVCDETETREIDALGHTQATIPGKAATCTETGLTDGVKCAVCGEILTAQETIPVTAHTEVTIPAVAATCTETGLTAGMKCSVCGKILTAQETTNALGHAWGEWVVDKEATGTEDGSQHRNCSRCDAVDTEVISKLPKQNVYWYPAGPIEWKYGEHTMVTNTAYNDTVEDCVFTYTSSNPNVAVMNEYGYAVIVGAGTTTITATAPAVPGQYAATSASYTLIINKADLTVTANNHTITYGQAPANNGWTASGFKDDDTQSVVTGTAAYTYTYEQYGNVGSYVINVSGLTAKNYNITFAPGTLTVSKATDYTITLGNLTQRDDSITPVTASIAPQDTTAEITVEYFVDGEWTTSLPTAAGEYQVRASLTGSSNIQTDGEYTTDTLTIQRSIGVDGTDVTVTVDDGKANITVTEDELADIVNNADGDVSINLGGVEDVDELVLPGSLLEALSESDKADSLTIATEDASISMSGGVLDTVASAVTSGEDKVTVKLAAVEEKDLNDDQQAALGSITHDAVIVEVSLVITHADGTETELHQLGGNVEVTVPYAGGVPAGKYIVVCYLSDDGNVTYVRATYNAETQQVTFTTNHFSNYAVFVSGDPAVVVDGGSGSGLYAEGTTVTIKADSKSGYTFAGWEVVSGGITLTDSKAAEATFTMPAANVELKATYTRVTSGGGGGGAVSTYTLTFDTNGGSKIDSVSKAGGATIDLTRYVPTRTGYDFDGWYSDAKLTDKVTSVKLTKDMTVYAKWTEKDDKNPFTDVSDDAYYADAVIWALGEGITSGTTATTFSPDAPCTRAQAVTFLWRAAGSPEPESMSSFADVPADSYYAKAVAWAVEQGITKGTSDTTFSPNATCTRAQIVTFLWRSQKSPVADGVNPFTDVAADAYYTGAVLWAAENGITGGTTASTFSPNNNCTRAQIVTFFYRCLGE